MLCFFPSLRDLDHCRELISNTDGNVEVVHARKSFAGGKKTDWYGCIFPSVEHTDDINEVKRHFSAISNETLREVHEKGEAWSKSFDSLSESPSGVVVENCSFLLDSVSWPPLQGAQNGVKDANWEICEVQTLSEILRNLELEHPESSDEWELLQRTPYSPSQDDPVYVPPTEESGKLPYSDTFSAVRVLVTVGECVHMGRSCYFCRSGCSTRYRYVTSRIWLTAVP
jgi:hypothetical protein